MWIAMHQHHQRTRRRKLHKRRGESPSRLSTSYFPLLVTAAAMAGAFGAIMLTLAAGNSRGWVFGVFLIVGFTACAACALGAPSRAVRRGASIAGAAGSA